MKKSFMLAATTVIVGAMCLFSGCRVDDGQVKIDMTNNPLTQTPDLGRFDDRDNTGERNNRDNNGGRDNNVGEGNNRNNNGNRDNDIIDDMPNIGGDNDGDNNLNDLLPNNGADNRDNDITDRKPNNGGNSFNGNNGSNNRTFGKILPTIKPVNYLNIRPGLDFVKSR